VRLTHFDVQPSVPSDAGYMILYDDGTLVIDTGGARSACGDIWPTANASQKQRIPLDDEELLAFDGDVDRLQRVTADFNEKLRAIE
jgi:hypothetical protein